MTSDEPDSASPPLRRIKSAQGFAKRAMWVSAAVWLATPFVVGISVGLGGPTWLWYLVAFPATVFILGACVFLIAFRLEIRFRGVRAAAEDLANDT